jgi:hypothetical protein
VIVTISLPLGSFSAVKAIHCGASYSIGCENPKLRVSFLPLTFAEKPTPII